MTRITTLALAVAFALCFSLGCDNRTKTEKLLDAAREKGAAWKEKLAAGVAKVKKAASKSEFLAAADDQADTIKAKIKELGEKIEDANPELKAKLKKQVATLKENLDELETAVKKAADDPEGTWEKMKAKAVAAMERAERAMEDQ